MRWMNELDDGAQERRPERRLYIHKMTSREGAQVELTPEGSGTLTIFDPGDAKISILGKVSDQQRGSEKLAVLIGQK